MASRPRLKPYFRPLRRGPDTVQLGVSHEAGGIVVSGLGPADLALLEQLDGTFSEHQVRYAVAARCGVAPERAAEILDLLREHRMLAVDSVDRVDLGRLRTSMRDGLLQDAEVLALLGGTDDPMSGIVARHHRSVVVSGTGRLPWSIAALLRSGGVGQVHLGQWALDAAEQELRDEVSQPPPDLVVLVAEGAVDPRQGEPWRRRSVPQLPVVSDGRRIVVGPLVGHLPGLPCLRCLEMSRADRDAAWPVVMAQLAPRMPGASEIPSESTMVAIAAGVVGMVTHAFLAGTPTPAGVSVEVTLPWPRLDHRRWHRHPRCETHAPDPTEPPEIVVGSPRARPADPRVTMTG